jgi:uncharacterized protein YfaS (alpha-2-macroglobulin family)
MPPAPVRAAGSRRFWFTVSAFALLNTAAWVGYDSWQHSRAPRRDLLAVAAFSPGDLAVLAADAPPPQLAWTFNLDVAAPGPIRPGPNGELPGAVKPAVAGAWRWSNPRTLTFTPEDRLPRATRFVATLDPASLHTPEGFTLPKPDARTFTTEPLALRAARQAAYSPDDRVILELEFNDKVIPGEVLRHLQVTGPDNQPLHVELHGQGAGSVVRVITEPVHLFREAADAARSAILLPGKNARPGSSQAPSARPLTLTLTAGLAGAGGPLGLDAPVTRQVDVAPILLAEGLDVTPDAAPSLTLRFNNDISESMLEAIRPLLSIDPPIPFTADRRSSSSREIALRADFQSGTRYLVSIAKVPSADDTRTFPRPAALSVFVPDRPATAWFQDHGGYLGSQGNRTVLVKAVNVPSLRVRADRLYENNLVAWRNTSHALSSFSHPVATKRYTLVNKKNALEELRINLDDLLGRDNADGVYELTLLPDDSRKSPGEDDQDAAWQWRRARNYDQDDSTLITLSDIALTAKLSAALPGQGQSLLAWAVSLSTGKPLPDVTVRLYSDKNQPLGEARSDASGLARLDRILPGDGEQPALLVASAGHALSWLRLAPTRDESRFDTAGRPYPRSGYDAFLWSDRGVYRPGDTVVLRGLLRGPDRATPPADLPLRWQSRRPDGRDFLAHPSRLDADGAAEWRLTLPADAPTGYWSAQLGLPGDPGAGSAGMTTYGALDFQVEDFIPDRLKVAAALAPAADSRLSFSQPLAIDIQADYLFGQPAARLQAAATVRLSPVPFTAADFPAADGWFAGDRAAVADVRGVRRDAAARLDTLKATLDDAGHAHLSAPLPASLTADTDRYAYRGPWRVSLTAEVLETGGRAVTAYAAAPCDALPYYLLARGANVQPNGYLTLNTPAAFDLRLVAPAGRPFPDARRIAVTVFREEWETVLVRESGRYRYQSTRTLTPIDDAAGTLEVGPQGAPFTFASPRTGTFVVQFADDATRQVTTTRLTFGEPGGWSDSITREHPEELQVQLVPADGALAKDTFRPGQSVKAIVHAPFAGLLLLTVETDRLLTTRVVDMPRSDAEVSLDLPPGARPNGYLAATVVRAIQPNKPWVTHRAFGLARFTVDPADRTLALAIDAPTEARPASPLDLAVRVTTPDGQPARNAAVALAAVDEGILRLTNYPTPNPLAAFEATRALAVETADIYSLLMPEVARPDTPSATGGDASAGRRHSSPVAARRVNPVALVHEIVHTDDAGVARLRLAVPEFLGQLRVMAVAYSGPYVGSADARVVVKSPLVVQPSFPRFLAPGDRSTASFLIINNTPAAGEVSLRLTAAPSELLTWEEPASVPLAPGQQTTISLPIRANSAIGVARLAVEARLGADLFTDHLELPIRPAAPAISRGDTVVVSPDKPGSLAAPPGMIHGTDALQVSVSPGPASGLAQGLDFLNRYPYGCLEQTTSTAFPLLYLKDIASAATPTAPAVDPSYKVQSAVIRLLGMQTASGGLAMWPGGSTDWSWGSVYAAHFLAEAKAAGYDVPADLEVRLTLYLRSLLAKSAAPSDDTEVQAYAAYVLALQGRPDRPTMNRLGEILAAEEKRPSPPPAIAEARLHLALAWASAGRRDLAQQLLPQTIPTFNIPRRLDGPLSSPVRDQALLALTLLSVDPGHAALPSVVQRLSASHRQWQNTQENAFALLALGKYLHTVPARPYARAQLLEGDRPLFTASDPAPRLFNLPATSPGPFVLRVEGEPAARAYFSWVQTGVPIDLPENADNALKVRRAYVDEGGAPLDPAALAAGDSVRVVVTVDAPTPLANVVLEDLLPAGLEVENPRLATAKQDDDRQAGRDLSPTRMDVRDDRIVVITDLPAGKSTWTYLARAVTPGDYLVPPVRAECMYDPAINSLHRPPGRLVIKPVSAEQRQPPRGPAAPEQREAAP